MPSFCLDYIIFQSSPKSELDTSVGFLVRQTLSPLTRWISFVWSSRQIYYTVHAKYIYDHLRTLMQTKTSLLAVHSQLWRRVQLQVLAVHPSPFRGSQSVYKNEQESFRSNEVRESGFSHLLFPRNCQSIGPTRADLKWLHLTRKLVVGLAPRGALL